MHIQIRVVPARSPAHLAELLEVLEQEQINIEAAGGSDVELGGEFAFAVAHGEEDHVMRVLRAARYAPRAVEVVSCELTNDPGQLLACIRAISESNKATGQAIKDIAVGVPDEHGHIQVQVYSE